MNETPDKKLKVGDIVLVRGYHDQGVRKIAEIYPQELIPGGVRLNREVFGFFSWNEDELSLAKEDS